MEKLFDYVIKLTDLMWGWPMIITLLITSVFLTLYLNFFQFRNFKMIVKNTIGTIFNKKTFGEGTITPFQAVSSALASSLGTGNISGVAVAISLGGPGAVFWMWVIAIPASILKYAEITLAIKYREKHPNGEFKGGFMWTLTNGLGDKFIPLAKFWAVFMAIEMLIGPSMHSNAIAESAKLSFGINPVIVGVIAAGLCGIVLLGGIKRIGALAEKIVPVMAVIYMIGAFLILVIQFKQIPNAFGMIFDSAFNGSAAIGGFAGSTVMLSLRYGFSRGTGSNEAGMGLAPFAHASAQTDFASRQGMWGVFEVFFDTIVMCTITALVVLVSGVFGSDVVGPSMTTAAFGLVLPISGKYIVTVTLILFAFTSMITNAYFGLTCWDYLFKGKKGNIYFLLSLVFIAIGSFMKFDYTWILFDTFMAVTVFINVIVIFLLRREVKEETNKFLEYVKTEKE